MQIILSKTSLAISLACLLPLIALPATAELSQQAPKSAAELKDKLKAANIDPMPLETWCKNNQFPAGLTDACLPALINHAQHLKTTNTAPPSKLLGDGQSCWWGFFDGYSFIGCGGF